MSIEPVMHIILLGFLVLTALAIARLKDLFAVIMLMGIYGLLSASFFVVMDAVDVAFTEAAVGAGISTLLMLTTLMLIDRYEHPTRHKPALALFVVSITGALLIYGTLDMPHFGSASAPIHQHVAPRYLEDSMSEVGIPNIVTSVLASYRAYDTLGEVVVIFTAGIGVMVLLVLGGAERRRLDTETPMHQHMILRIVVKKLIPFILLFALYVQFHGDYGPGGGFQAGVIFAAGIIVYAMVFSFRTAKRVINEDVIQFLAALGLLLYGSVGLLSMLLGKNYLDYSALAEDAVAGQHLGILVIELGVGITVASIMIIIFFSFSGRRGNGNGNKDKTKR